MPSVSRSATALQPTSRIDARLTGQTPLRERRPRIAPALVGEDRQLEHRHPGELDAVVFGLANRLRWPEIPLLPQNLPERAPAVRRPAQHELLRARRVRLDEEEPHAAQALRPVEDEPDGRLARLRGLPPSLLFRHERGFDGIASALPPHPTPPHSSTSTHLPS